MKKRYILPAMLCILVILLSSCKSSESYRRDKEIIRQFVTAYGKNAKLETAAIEELATQNPDAGKRWQRIMDYWQYANDEMPINGSESADNLADDRNLCIIVLGFQLNPDGSMKEELIGRLETALCCAKRYPDAYILCTGGGTASGNRAATEADTMANWLRDNGVTEERLIIENNSLSTIQNAQFSYAILCRDYPDIDSVMIVSSDYHIPWGAVLFETQFILGADSAELQQIHTVSNAAYAAANAQDYPIRSYQMNGILEIAGIQ